MINVTALSGTGLPDDLAAVGVPVHSSADGPVLAFDPAAVVRRGPADLARRRLVRTPGVRRQGGPDPSCVRDGRSTADPTSCWWAWASADALPATPALESLRRAAASFVRSAGTGGIGAARPSRGDGDVDDRSWPRAAAEGGALATYRYDEFRSADPTDRAGRPGPRRR